MEFAVLGPLTVRVDGRTLSVPGRRERTLLSLLLVQRNRVVSTAALTAELFQPDAPATATGALRVHVSRLRRSMAAGTSVPLGVLESHRGGYLLRVPDSAFDAAVFEAMAARARSRLDHAPELAADLLRAALALWRGAAFCDADASPLVGGEAARLEELRLAAVEDRVEADSRCGRHRLLAAELEALAPSHPLRERLWGAWMLALYRCGRQADALQVYQQLRGHLAEHLAIEPSLPLQRLERAVLVQDRVLDWAPVSASVQEEPVHNLPLRLTSFVGRTRELEQVHRLHRSTRLLTLIGTGGCGKTRLALELASSVTSEYPDGVRLADLSTVRDPADLDGALARAWNLPDEPFRSTRDSLLRHLRNKRALVVLDCCEHLLPHSAELASALLHHCPSLTLLATSREPLSVVGEIAWRVPSLNLPAAARLLMDRAQRVHPEVRLVGVQDEAIREICRRLDGIPLAIELAAACLRSLTPQEVVAALDDRFALLAGGARDAVPRHRTLRASVLWSYELLSPVERAAFRRVSIFAGGFLSDAAQAVGVDRRVLERLVDTSLVIVEQSGNASRFRLLETLRSFAEQELQVCGEQEEVARQHRDHYLAWADQAGRSVQGDSQDQVLDALAEELPNLRAAFHWSRAAGEEEAALRLASALEGLWLYRARYLEGRAWFDAVLPPSPRAAPAVAARALTVGARVEAMLFGERAGSRARAAQDLLDPGEHPGAVAAALTAAGLAVVYFDAEASGLLTQAVQLARVAGDQALLADALAGLALSHFLAGDAQAARPLAEEGRVITRSLGHRYLSRIHAFVLASSLLVQGELQEAHEQIAAVEVEARRAGDAQLHLSALLVDSMIQSLSGDPASGLRLAERSLQVAQETGVDEYSGHGWVLVGFAALAAGDVAAAGRAFQRASGLVGFLPSTRALACWGMTTVAVADGDLEAADRHAADAAACFPAGARSWYAAQSQLAVAQVRLAEKDWRSTGRLARTALRSMRRIGMGIFVADALEVLAAGLHGQGKSGAAAICLAEAEERRRATGEVRMAVYQARHDTLVADLRVPRRRGGGSPERRPSSAG